MEKEEKVVVVLTLMALSSLLAAYFCFGSAPGEGEASAAQLNAASKVGDKVSFEATVLSKRSTFKDEHLLLKVDHNSDVVTVFIPAKAGASSLNETLGVGDKVSISGILAEYQGEKEVKVQDKSGVVVLQTSGL